LEINDQRNNQVMLSSSPAQWIIDKLDNAISYLPANEETGVDE